VVSATIPTAANLGFLDPAGLSKKIPNGFRDRAILLYRRATRHVLTLVTKCIDIDGGIIKNVLH
jgi:hypothetical protein